MKHVFLYRLYNFHFTISAPLGLTASRNENPVRGTEGHTNACKSNNLQRVQPRIRCLQKVVHLEKAQSNPQGNISVCFVSAFNGFARRSETLSPPTAASDKMDLESTTRLVAEQVQISR